MTDVPRALRIGLLTHSTNPRGGVVHVLELASALAALGHEVVVYAPDESGRGFFRPVSATVHVALMPAMRTIGGLGALVRQRVKEYVDFLLPRIGECDLYHAHDGISGNSLANLVDRGAIPSFVRTVHHMDDFADPFLREAQLRSVLKAGACICVSQAWADTLKHQYEISAGVISNGVDLDRFSPSATERDGEWLSNITGPVTRPLFLAVGGVERRKNTLNLLRSFLLAKENLPQATLLIVGGASLLDHSGYRREFDHELAQADASAAACVHLTGPVPDDAMPALYRSADTLVFPSVTEGFGLAVLEAMACGTPVITSRIRPFTEYLTDHDAILVNPLDTQEIASAMHAAVDSRTRTRLRSAGLKVASRFPWQVAATKHVEFYRRFLVHHGELAYAGNAIPSSLA